jgi:hypothetical protein
VITSPGAQTISYIEKDASTLITSLAFSENIGTCGSFTYTLTDSLLSPYDSTVFTFNAITPTINVYTTDSLKIGIYNLIVTGTLGSWGSSTTTV